MDNELYSNIMNLRYCNSFRGKREKKNLSRQNDRSTGLHPSMDLGSGRPDTHNSLNRL